MPLLNNLDEFNEWRAGLETSHNPSRPRYAVCSGSGCNALKSGRVADALEAELKTRGLSGKAEVVRMGCHGLCERGPIVLTYPDETVYVKVSPEDASELVETATVKGAVLDRLLFRDASGALCRTEGDIPFYSNQTRLVFGMNRLINRSAIEDYVAAGGYSALVKALFSMAPEAVLDEVKKANLRGRGGGGFPAGIKWETTRNAPADVKYVIVNADEGDPGAFMDGALLEGNPHRVLEGLLIGGYAIGAKKGFVYIRQEYPLALDSLEKALHAMRLTGLLGENILDSGFSFEIKVHRGAGSFVSGESSALMSSIEGRVGEPRAKYIRTSVSGVHGKPSNLNNVETWATVPLIIERGADWFASIGTEGSKGTKIFSLVGKVNNTGLVEVPMGTTIRKIIYDIGQGLRDGKKFKAVQTGGPSGGVLPENLLDLPVDYDELTKAGSMMGSGGMIVMDEETCMVDVAKYFLDFLSGESCGKCIPCREGIWQLVHILNRITSGEAREDDIELLEDLSWTIKDCSLCGLGQSAPNPLLSSLKYFRDEYVAHVAEHRCPAGVCKPLVVYWIDPETCIGCQKCAKACPVGAITGEKKEVHVIDGAKCTKCDSCYQGCPPKVRAVKKLSRAEAQNKIDKGNAA